MTEEVTHALSFASRDQAEEAARRLDAQDFCCHVSRLTLPGEPDGAFLFCQAGRDEAFDFLSDLEPRKLQP